MTSYGSGVDTSAYQYRADGMRTKKVVGSTTTTYRYDGQMGMQDVEVNGSTTTVTDYALGARGVDAISKSVNGAAATVSFPLYDAHGNTIGTLARSGSTFTTANERYYDAWGAVNFGGTTGDPKGRYCASIGHKQDDESGLVYMRARYYEPDSGRFVSEDPARDGSNWFAYCANDPVNRTDADGRCDLSVGWCAFAAFFITFLYVGATTNDLGKAFLAALVSASSAAAIALGSNALGRATEMSAIAAVGAKIFGGGFTNAIAQLMIDLITGDEPGGDLALAFLSGAASPFLPAHGNAYDAGQGALIGSGIQALYNAGESALVSR